MANKLTFSAFNHIRKVDLSALNSREGAPHPAFKPTLGEFASLGKSIMDLQGNLAEKENTHHAAKNDAGAVIAKPRSLDQNTLQSSLIEHNTKPSVSIDYHLQNKQLINEEKNVIDSTNIGIPKNMPSGNDGIVSGIPNNDSIDIGIPTNRPSDEVKNHTTHIDNDNINLSTNHIIIEDGVKTSDGTNFGIPEMSRHHDNTSDLQFDCVGGIITGMPNNDGTDVGMPNNIPSQNSLNSAKDLFPFLHSDQLNPDKPLDDLTLYHVDFRSRFLQLDRSILTTLKSISGICDKILYLKFIRFSYGFGNCETNIPIGPESLSKKLLISKNKIKQSINSLCGSSLIEKTSYVHTKGSTYRVFLDPTEKRTIFNKSNCFIIDQNIIDVLPAVLDPGALLVYFYLYLESFGLNKNITKERIGYQTLSNDLGLSRNTIKKHRDTLISVKLIHPVCRENNDGTFYRIFLPHEIIDLDQKNKPLLKYRSTGTIIDSTYSGIPKRTPSDGVLSGTPISGIPESDVFGRAIPGIPKFVLGNSISSSDKILTSTGTDSGIPVSVPHNNTNNNKTSSGDADDFLNFLKSKLNSQIQFPLSKEKLEGYIAGFGLDICKQNLQRLKSRLTTAANPVGLWIDSLKNPANYPELSQKSEVERVAGERETYEKKKREQIFQEQERARMQKEFDDHWSTLNDEIKNVFIQQSTEHFRAATPSGLLPPQAAILERAKRVAMEEKSI